MFLKCFHFHHSETIIILFDSNLQNKQKWQHFDLLLVACVAKEHFQFPLRPDFFTVLSMPEYQFHIVFGISQIEPSGIFFLISS
jgi:hypothetical protein